MLTISSGDTAYMRNTFNTLSTISEDFLYYVTNKVPIGGKIVSKLTKHISNHHSLVSTTERETALSIAGEQRSDAKNLEFIKIVCSMRIYEWKG